VTGVSSGLSLNVIQFVINKSAVLCCVQLGATAGSRLLDAADEDLRRVIRQVLPPGRGEGSEVPIERLSS